jgi:DNA (cytosine-5)-methyltransferase 1
MRLASAQKNLPRACSCFGTIQKWPRLEQLGKFRAVNSFRVLDLFCGGGGSSYGARKAGCEIVAGVDAWETASDTWGDNFLRGKAICARLEGDQILPQVKQLHSIDLLLASPECTNHTCAKGGKPRSEDSRATAMQVLTYARALHPKCMVIENVVHMRSWSRYHEFIEGIRDLDYAVKPLVIDAAEVGVPQSRRRLFIICTRRELNIDAPRGQARTPASSILDPHGIWPVQLLRKKGRAEATLERAARGIAEVGTKEPFLLVYYGSDGAGGWQSLDVPLRTITTLDRFGLVEPGPHGHTLRMLQVSELRRAMGFENDFLMNRGSRRDRIKILGNGVCPPVMRWVVNAIADEMRQGKRRARSVPGQTMSASAIR